MKIRKGFVSNSSSSSFLIVGRKIGEFCNIEDIKFEKGKKYAMIGTYLNDGLDVMCFDMNRNSDKELLQWFVDNRKPLYEKKYLPRTGAVYEVIQRGEDFVALDLELLTKAEKPVYCFCYERDYNFTVSIKTAKERYLGE